MRAVNPRDAPEWIRACFLIPLRIWRSPLVLPSNALSNSNWLTLWNGKGSGIESTGYQITASRTEGILRSLLPSWMLPGPSALRLLRSRSTPPSAYRCLGFCHARGREVLPVGQKLWPEAEDSCLVYDRGALAPEEFPPADEDHYECCR